MDLFPHVSLGGALREGECFSSVFFVLFQTNGQTDGQTENRTDKQTDGWTDGMDGLADKWRRTDRPTNQLIN